MTSFLCFKLFILFLSLLSHFTSSSIPRSTRNNYDSYSINSPQNPPWNPSSKIDDNGFLKEVYRCIPGEWEASEMPPELYRKCQVPSIVQIRQVPGDGNCLFHSIATCLSFVLNQTHVEMRNGQLSSLMSISKKLRQDAVTCLSKRPRRPLFIQGNEYLRACDLVQAAASQYNLTGDKYCELMRRESYWGGGPEIVALCNVLRRPIYVYELVSASSVSKKQSHLYETDDDDDDESSILCGGGMTSRSNPSGDHSLEMLNHGFCLRRMACFGSPKFDRREALHILSADSRFPDVIPGRQLQNGNHFLSLFPVTKFLDLKGGSSSRVAFKSKKFGFISKKTYRSHRKAQVERDDTISNENLLFSWFGKIKAILIRDKSD